MTNIRQRAIVLVAGLVCLLGTSSALACDNAISSAGKSDDRVFYTYNVTEKNSCGFLNLSCCTGATRSYTIPIGMGRIPPELRQHFGNWPDGCSGGIEGDKQVWEVAVSPTT